MDAYGQVPEGGSTGDPGPFDQIFDLGRSDATAPTVMPSAPVEESVAPKTHHRSLIIGIVSVVVIAAVVIPAVFVFSAATAAISAGNGTATITWIPTSGIGDTSSVPPQSFSGNINGQPVSGVATVSIPLNSPNPFASPTGASKDLQIFGYKGSFAGKPFNIAVLVRLPVSISSAGAESFIIQGTYNGQAVHATLGQAPNSNLRNPPISFNGTIGSWYVTGSIRAPSGGSGTQTATATFTVSS